MMLRNTDLEALVNAPRETLDIEVKEWLDLTDNDHKAALAKEIIALANHGGGYVVIGFSEQTDGSFHPHKQRPPELTAWSQDAVQSIVSKYIDPAIQCSVVHSALHSDSEKYPIIAVPGGHGIPIRAKASSPNEKRLVANRIYIRRPGPASEEPKTAQDWDQLLNRCLQNRKEDLLNAMRSIMAGVIPNTGSPASTRLEILHAYEADASAKWAELIDKLPPNAPPRFVHGYYDLSFAIDQDVAPIRPVDLKHLIEREIRNYSGWPPFLTLNRMPYQTRLVADSIQFWRGPDELGNFDIPRRHDFWRISPQGLFFTRCGYSEDSGPTGTSPGTTFDLVAPTWRLGEAILQASYIARALGAEKADLICHAKWTSLTGRSLVSVWSPNRILFENRTAQQAVQESTRAISLTALPNTLPEIVFDMLSPLYELFDFFVLPKRLVEEELVRMRAHS